MLMRDEMLLYFLPGHPGFEDLSEQDKNRLRHQNPLVETGKSDIKNALIEWFGNAVFEFGPKDQREQMVDFPNVDFRTRKSCSEDPSELNLTESTETPASASKSRDSKPNNIFVNKNAERIEEVGSEDGYDSHADPGHCLNFKCSMNSVEARKARRESHRVACDLRKKNFALKMRDLCPKLEKITVVSQWLGGPGNTEGNTLSLSGNVSPVLIMYPPGPGYTESQFWAIYRVLLIGVLKKQARESCPFSKLDVDVVRERILPFLFRTEWEMEVNFELVGRATDVYKGIIL